MRIIHYTLGVYPYRSGGMTKYSEDIANEQRKHGNDVFIFYPGGICLPFNKIKIS